MASSHMTYVVDLAVDELTPAIITLPTNTAPPDAPERLAFIKGKIEGLTKAYEEFLIKQG